jgi:polyisoprenoid-binding protein YceI
MNVRSLSLAAVLAFATTAAATETETYSIDPTHANVGFEVRHIMSTVPGRFNEFEGTIQVNRVNPEASRVEFSIDAGSIDTRNQRRDEHLRSGDFFDVATHPTITFRSTSIKQVDDETFEVTGDFTMRGVTKSITLPVSLLGEMTDPWGNRRMGFETSTTIDRKDFGVSWNQVLDQGGLLLGDEVEISIDLQAVRQDPATD